MRRNRSKDLYALLCRPFFINQRGDSAIAISKFRLPYQKQGIPGQNQIPSTRGTAGMNALPSCSCKSDVSSYNLLRNVKYAVQIPTEILPQEQKALRSREPASIESATFQRARQPHATKTSNTYNLTYSPCYPSDVLHSQIGRGS